jgi:hypothetical protein
MLLTTIAIDEYGLPIQVPIFYPLQAGWDSIDGIYTLDEEDERSRSYGA